MKELPPPHDGQSLKRVLGLFSHCAQWIPKFFDKISPLVKSKSFPLTTDAKNAFELVKSEIEKSVVVAIDEFQPFKLETDASDIALAAVLNQNGKPVKFFSRTLHGSELKNSSIEKEASAIIEAVRHWKHFLTNHHFIHMTDQKSVRFMFDKKNKGNIKNDKIYRWRMELSLTLTLFINQAKIIFLPIHLQEYTVL